MVQQETKRALEKLENKNQHIKWEYIKPVKNINIFKGTNPQNLTAHCGLSTDSKTQLWASQTLIS